MQPNRSITNITTNFGGIPFLDEEFQPQRVLAAVATLRIQRLKGKLCDLSAQFDKANPQQVLTPAYARQIYKCEPKDIGLHCKKPSPTELQKIRQAESTIISVCPTWKPLVSLPIEFLKLTDSTHGISASVDVLPQHIFLSDQAFITDDELCEQILHELCHNWMYLISEVWKLHWTGTKVYVTLPSGTSEITPSKLLGSMHVVTVLIKFYDARKLFIGKPGRDLTGYRSGCAELISAIENCFTDAGREVASRLIR